jgi:hypothetical protein
VAATGVSMVLVSVGEGLCSVVVAVVHGGEGERSDEERSLPAPLLVVSGDVGSVVESVDEPSAPPLVDKKPRFCTATPHQDRRIESVVK